MNRGWGGVAAALLSLGLAACDSGSASAPAGVDAAVEAAILDAEGRPLALPTDDPGVIAFEAELLRLVNDHRAARGLAALVAGPKIADVARAHSRNMADLRFFSHESPGGTSPGDRLGLVDVGWDAVGENLAAGAGFASPQAVFEAWLDSPTHRANLESSQYTHAGAGYVHDPDPPAEFPHVHYWTLLLLQP
jgi:uncharacterized protein YkwD